MAGKTMGYLGRYVIVFAVIWFVAVVLSDTFNLSYLIRLVGSFLAYIIASEVVFGQKLFGR
jgi:hypothetical protein